MKKILWFLFSFVIVFESFGFSQNIRYMTITFVGDPATINQLWSKPEAISENLRLFMGTDYVLLHSLSIEETRLTSEQRSVGINSLLAVYKEFGINEIKPCKVERKAKSEDGDYIQSLTAIYQQQIIVGSTRYNQVLYIVDKELFSSNCFVYAPDKGLLASLTFYNVGSLHSLKYFDDGTKIPIIIIRAQETKDYGVKSGEDVDIIGTVSLEVAPAVATGVNWGGNWKINNIRIISETDANMTMGSKALALLRDNKKYRIKGRVLYFNNGDISFDRNKPIFIYE